MNDREKHILVNLQKSVREAHEVSARDHARKQESGHDSYAFDFGALEACVREIAHAANYLAEVSEPTLADLLGPSETAPLICGECEFIAAYSDDWFPHQYATRHRTDRAATPPTGGEG